MGNGPGITDDTYAQETLELALIAGQLGTWRWDRLTGVTVWDATLERLFGLEPGTFPKTFEAYAALLHPDDRGRVLATVERAVAAHTSYQVDHRIVWPDGTVRWIQGRGTVTLDEQGEVTGTLGCVGDITDLVEARHQLEQRASDAWDRVEENALAQERLEFLVRIGDAALAADTHLEFMEAVTSAAVPRLGDWCTLHFIPEGTAHPLCVVAHRDPARRAWARALLERFPFDPDDGTGVAEVIRSGRRRVVLRVTDNVVSEALDRSSVDRATARAVLDELGLTSVITVPLRTKEGVIGAMQFVSAESGRVYDLQDVTLAEAAAGRIADGLYGLWHADQQRRIAVTLQQALLPTKIAEIDGIGIAVRYWPAGASEAGGDFYDVFGFDDDRWAVLIGDVCGTGPDAAAVTSIARHTVRAAARHGQDHASVLKWLNEAVCRSERDRFCTAAYSTIERHGDRWRFEVSCGGHPLPWVVRADGTTEPVGASGTLLGVFDRITVRPRSVELGAGDTIVLYTDGLTDLPGPGALDQDGLAEMVTRAAGASGADQVADRLTAELAERVPFSERHDDIAFVVLRVDSDA